ncbi:MAG: hypothetical protein IKH96_04765 [Ruminococcus sp.]|uniref:hypothetical protein n=1 Tax=Ruminococcus sp. TaxID=41978 RepID=UPI0025E5E143|nr:hypothetical protein [Ruminococcus sp.]MBR6995315.1 hypothetical protein [Ruminococcus sp.]
MDREQYFGEKIKGRKEEAIASAVREALESFCDQEPEFEQAIEQSGKTFQDCLKEVVNGCGSCLSDIEAYRRAVKFYFSTATVSFRMTIDLSGDNGAAKPITMSSNKKDTLSMSLDDLLNF